MHGGTFDLVARYERPCAAGDSGLHVRLMADFYPKG